MSEREDTWHRFAEAYRQEAPVSPDAKQRLLDRISATPPPQRTGWVLALERAVFEPRLSAFVAVGAVVAAFLLGATITRFALRPTPDRTLPAVGIGAPADSLVPVRFILIAPEARAVSVAGDFNRWEVGSLRMTRVSADGLWTGTVSLPRGSHLYSFVIDGNRWVSDPTAPLGPDDGFGLRSSVVVVRDPLGT